MEASIATSKGSCHARSNSLPSRSHPLIVSVEDQLQRLRASSEATTSSPSKMCRNLAGLKDLFECLDNMLQLPLACKAFCDEQQDKCVEDVLDGSLRLLDLCSNTRDVISHMKSCVQELESSLRRRNVGESSLANEIDKYMISRKQVNKMVRKCSGDFKTMQKEKLAILDKDQDQDLVIMVDILKEVESVNFTVFKSLLTFICPTNARSKSTGWSLVSKLVQSKRVSSEEEMENLEKLDGILNALIRNKKCIDVIQVQKTQKNLEALESTLQEIEEGVECVFRFLIKTRVSLLNIFNH